MTTTTQTDFHATQLDRNGWAYKLDGQCWSAQREANGEWALFDARETLIGTYPSHLMARMAAIETFEARK